MENNYKPYGTKPDYDTLVDSAYYRDRISAAQEGYGLDKLKNDTDEMVRVSVAENCKGDISIIESMINDECWRVREALALTIGSIINDFPSYPNENTQKQVDRYNEFLNILKNDDAEQVRYAVVIRCENENIVASLANDDVEYIRKAADERLQHLQALRNAYQETNFRIEPTNNQTFLVRSDSERFGKDAIVYESHKREDCLNYISLRREPTHNVKAYIIPDLKNMVTHEKPFEPIEYYDTIDDAVARFKELRSERNEDYSDYSINPNSKLPYSRLCIGIEGENHRHPVDVIHLMENEKILIDDFTRRADINTDKGYLDAIKKILQELDGVPYLLDYSKDRNNPKFTVVAEWDNPYFNPAEIYNTNEAKVKYLSESRNEDNIPKQIRSDNTIITSGKSLSAKIEYAVDVINEEILSRGIDDFVAEFDPNTNTAYVVSKCLTNNLLDVDKLRDLMSDKASKDYLHNILVQWKGVPYEKADKMLGFRWDEPMPSVSAIKKDIIAMFEKYSAAAPDNTCFAEQEYGYFRVEAYKTPSQDGNSQTYSYQVYAGKEHDDTPICDKQEIVPQNGTFITPDNYESITKNLLSLHDRIVKEYNKPEKTINKNKNNIDRD